MCLFLKISLSISNLEFIELPRYGSCSFLKEIWGFCHYFFKYFFFLSLSSSGTPMIHISVLLKMPHLPIMLCSFFIFSFLFFSLYSLCWSILKFRYSFFCQFKYSLLLNTGLNCMDPLIYDFFSQLTTVQLTHAVQTCLFFFPHLETCICRGPTVVKHAGGWHPNPPIIEVSTVYCWVSPMNFYLPF